MLSWYNHAESPLWVMPREDASLKESIIKEFKIHPVIAQVLVSRGFNTLESIHKYLYAKLPDLYDPFLMAEMPQAVSRVIQAIEQKENILIYGDNDVDGMTGTALLVEYLRFLGANVFFYVSNRSTLRQSIIVEALEYALKNDCKLLITVDCGITAANEIAKVVEQNVDVIITDHHVPTDTIPNCVATLNPKLLKNTYPNADLTGVGVAFKLTHGITKQLVAEGKIPPRKIDLKKYLDLVALGTISDMGSLLGENRILVRYGLQQLTRGRRVGLSKLISVSDPDVNMGDLTAFTIASKVAPRLNSLGRIDDPTKGVQLLLIRNTSMAEKMAIELDLNNIERQKIERMVAGDVDQTISANPNLLLDKAIVLSSQQWHPGVIAIVTTRISKYYHRPTIMIAIENGIGKGSIRSIPEFPILSVLKSCSDILLNWGGHDFAAGLTVQADKIDEFKRRFIEAANQKLKNHDIMTKLSLDAEINFEEITFDFMESLKLLEPYGNENHQPIFFCKAKQAWPPKVVGKSHLKLYLQQGDRMLEGIAFGKAQLGPNLRRKNLTLLVAFTPQINTYQGLSIQLLIRDFKVLKEEELDEISISDRREEGSLSPRALKPKLDELTLD
ncbi:single-stranded-DNA-specific exonuclease RecJ [Estrella lausannensis]|uniref:Single-stranded-DNA-specific exonuclease RecJ n=1 Tax=Estrella lausannensis TaxID=483423 RepID=A0A0H5DT78_9BACT|nr:single-stranded-DNA-specific exonuclease RecJ [Estrella lausannensis]CRX39029.1 Single-stranded-DNA-specific exonuclease RecJ [Estrella lausannensis]